ncbi:hypothetical protein ElyMa_000730600 [Elysia marginata]|uniref:Uncharacterized protein n=1 Tax=Elysia marginata TaxID=1093978 RepID=A0AAV4GNZ4_9GAST|nr:hypothetical protein ElyMa_000730600 [Elysia marginata]
MHQSARQHKAKSERSYAGDVSVLAACSVPKDGQGKSQHSCGLAAVENSKLVASYAVGPRGHASRVKSSQTDSPASQIPGCLTSAFSKNKIVGLSLIRRRLEIKGVQSKSACVILSAWRPATRKPYEIFSENGYNFVIENK